MPSQKFLDAVRWHRCQFFAIVFALIFGGNSMQAAEPTSYLDPAQLTMARLYAEPALAGQPPIQMKQSPDGSRVTFLRGKSENSFALDLWSYDIKSKKTALLVDSTKITGRAETISAEEKSRRERMRIAALTGIVEYYFSEDGKQLLFPLSGALYLYDIKSGGVNALTDVKDGTVSDPKFSPKGRFVSFVRGQNLYAIELASKRLIALSKGGGGSIAFGAAEFVAQEEMDRFTGYWWAPDESHVAMQRYDEANVTLAKRFEIYSDRTEVVEQRYPAAGLANAQVELFIVPINAPAKPVKVDLGANLDIYLARVNWLPDGKALAVQRQSRDQKTLDLLRVDVKTGATSVLLTERSEKFVNLNHALTFLKTKPEFIWASERSGFNHLYRYDLTGRFLATLTQGDWQVDSLLRVDESTNTAFFAGNVSDPIQQQVYAVALDATTSTPKQITRGPGSHVATFSEDAKQFLDSYSDLLTPPQVCLYKADGRLQAVLDANEVKPGHALYPYQKNLITPEYGVLNNDDQPLNYRIYKPSNFDANKHYPALVYTYGGPHVQVLQRKFGDLLPQVFAQQGYVVFSLDNRGSARRGVAFEAAIYEKMGGPDVADQLAGIRWLGAQSYVDKSRVGVYGWSYGGYMTLQILTQGGNLVKAGAAGAPVTDWALYDTHYTERYMATPSENPAGYKAATVATHLDGLTARLLLMHGMADDNVLFTNTTTLMSELQARGIAFDLMTYPGMRHGPANPKTKLHIYAGVEAFFKRELGL
jgi:dipeptidyl-peptidase 4